MLHFINLYFVQRKLIDKLILARVDKRWVNEIVFYLEVWNYSPIVWNILAFDLIIFISFL